MVEFNYCGSVARAVAVGAALICTSCATPSLVTPAMHEQAPGRGETACLVRGLGGPLTSYLAVGRGVLEQLGFTVALHEMTVAPTTLRPCAVIVAHSAGAVSALATVGRRQIFIIDGFVSFLQRCPEEAACTNFYNPGDILSGRLTGARNVNCFTSCGVFDAVPLLAHETMPASREVWRAISEQLALRTKAVAENSVHVPEP